MLRQPLPPLKEFKRQVVGSSAVAAPVIYNTATRLLLWSVPLKPVHLLSPREDCDVTPHPFLTSSTGSVSWWCWFYRNANLTGVEPGSRSAHHCMRFNFHFDDRHSLRQIACLHGAMCTPTETCTSIELSLISAMQGRFSAQHHGKEVGDTYCNKNNFLINNSNECWMNYYFSQSNN